MNLKRIAKFAEQNNKKRVELFIKDNEKYIHELKNSSNRDFLNRKLDKYFKFFEIIKKTQNFDESFIDDIHTYSNILNHRANLF